MKKRIWLYIVIFEIVLIFLGIHYIYSKKAGVLGVATISPISKESIVMEHLNNLKYFYEPIANTKITDGINTPNRGVHTINADSLNATRDYAVTKPKNTFRIVALGDSFTFGLYVDTKDSWPEVLENELNSMKCSTDTNFEVINLGMDGYDSRYEVERFKKRGVKYKPDLVIWLHTDFTRVRELLTPLLKDYQNIPPEKIDRKKLYQSWVDGVANLYKTYGYTKLEEYNEAAINEMSDYYKGSLLLIPMPGSIKDNQKTILESIASEHKGWNYFDGLRDIYKYEGFFGDGHPNQKGHKMMAEDISNYLKSSKLISCN